MEERTAKKDARECGWLGCGDPRCEPVCAGAPSAEKDRTYTRDDMAQAWMDGAFYYGGDAAEQWYFNDNGSTCNPYVTPPERG